MPKLQKQKNGSFTISLPKDFVKKLGWQPSDEILVTFLDEDKLKLEKL